MRKGTIVECIDCKQMKPLYSKKRCIGCYGRERSKVYRDRQKNRIKNKNYDRPNLERFFRLYWDTHPERKCLECGEDFFKFRTWHIHHVALKSKYPEHAFNPDVCVYLCLGCHAKAHSTPKSKYEEKMPKTYEKFLELKEQLNIELYV